MRKSACLLVVMITTCLFSLATFAQTSVSGTVKNNTTGEVVPAVSVTVKGTNQGTFTDQDGQFTLKVAKLPVTLVFTSIGYDSYETTVSDATAVEVSFKPNPLLGQEVVVSANRTPQRILESPVTVERMGGSVLKSAATPNYYEAIGNLKGVDMHTASLTFRTVTTRGFISSGNTRLNQFVDGMDNQAPGLNFAVGSMVGPTELDVDNVELLAGASSALYGSGGMNGTLLINSKNPFKHQGLSFNIKQGVNHTDGKQRSVSPYYDWSLRWAKSFNDKFAFKIGAQLIQAQDWEADDYRNVSRTGIVSKVIGGNRGSDANYDGVNMYGDETTINMKGVAQSVLQVGTSGFVQAAMGLNRPPTAAEIQGFLGNPGAQTALNNFLATNANTAPFYIGLRDGHIIDQNVSREGYKEKDLVDYNTYNVRLSGALHYKITNDIEASWTTYFGTGTTVYTGADRYSLKNFKIGQHKLEIKGKNWMVRGYTTQEDAGNAYQATALGRLMNEAYKPSTTWYPQYVAAYSNYIRSTGPPVNANSDMQAHAFARAYADTVGGTKRFLPGTPQFEAAKEKILNTPLPQGARFIDKSDLWVYEAQLNLSDILGFSDVVDVLAGGNYRMNVLNSEGTLFTDKLGKLKVDEYGAYLQLKKKFFDKLTLSASGRYDKHMNFKGRFTPRITGVYEVAKDHNIRVSYQTAYRFPTNQDQYIELVTGSAVLIGGLEESFGKHGLTANNTWTAASVSAARATGDKTKLVKYGTLNPIKPETVSSYEVGYKGVFNKKLFVDAYFYLSEYSNFISNVAVVKAVAEDSVMLPNFSTNYSFKENVSDKVKTYGWGISADYNFAKSYFIYGNVFSDVLEDVGPNSFSFFNAPKYRFNLGLRNENFYRGVGFNVVVKYQADNYYEGTFVTGTLPSFATVDAQVTYKVPKTKSTFRIGGTNIGNNYYRTGFGSPYVGGLYYISYGFNL
jgi:outer membrane receptor protein involved in Fe transport